MRLQNYICVTALFLITCCISLSAQTFQNLSSVSGTLNQGLFSTNLAWGDYDGDGFLDLYCTNWGTAVTNPISGSPPSLAVSGIIIPLSVCVCVSVPGVFGKGLRCFCFCC